MSKYFYDKFPYVDFPRGMEIKVIKVKNERKVCELLGKVKVISKEINSIKRGFELREEYKRREDELFDDYNKRR
ncbi:unnamed protein product [marine sediment metagenome]|uniref:Uncharacterized protein n=1 Tax=marine sediment metagenome TaxID=412755 RepID=X1D168_9ZZZZ